MNSGIVGFGIVGLTVGVLAVAGWAQSPASSMNKAEMTKDQRASYALGYVLRQRLEEQGVEIDEDALVAGFRSLRGDEPPLLTPDEMREALGGVMERRRPQRTNRGGVNVERLPGAAEPAEDPRGGIDLRIDQRIGPERLDTAVPETRRNTYRGDNPNAEEAR